jgi:protein phosphatase
MLRQGDILMLCSDGLTNMLTDDEINRIICSHRGELDRMADMLVSGANSRGGVDNISVMLVER